MTVWLITGAGRGLGLEIARAALAGGEHVVAGMRNPANLPDDLRASERVLPVKLDITDPAQIKDAVSRTTERFGGIDVLVNNAAQGFLGAIEEISDAETRKLFDLNVFGLLNMTRAVLPVMRAAGHGKIVNIGSRAGFEGEPGVGIYAATKFAVAGLSEALAAELQPFGIQAMVVEPGVFRTDFLDSTSMNTPGQRLDAYEGTVAHHVLDRLGEFNHQQDGDPVKGAALIHRVVSGDRLPGHLPVGADAVERRKVVTARIERDIAPWKNDACATAHHD